MATIETALYSVLTADSNVTDLVSTRISPLLLKQGSTLPAVTYQIVSSVPEHAMGDDPGIWTTRVQLTSWGSAKDGADGYGDAVDVREQLKTTLSRYSGTVDGIRIDEIFEDLEGPSLFDPESKRVGLPMDFIVHHRG